MTNKIKGIGDIQDGYLIELRDGRKLLVYHCEDIDGGEDVLCVSGENDWWPLSCYDEDMIYEAEFIGIKMPHKPSDIMKIWGRTYPKGASQLDTEDRELLWERSDGSETEKVEDEKAVKDDKDDDKDDDDKSLEELIDEVKAEMKADGYDDKTIDAVVGLGLLGALFDSL